MNLTQSNTQLRTAIREDLFLSASFMSINLKRYFLRRWHTPVLLALVKEGCINYEGTKFQVVWHGGKVAATKGDYCYLSFREPHGKLIMPVVMIRPVPSYSACLTMFQDAAGNVPSNTEEQPTGFIFNNNETESHS